MKDRNLHAGLKLKWLFIVVPVIILLTYLLLPKLPSSPMIKDSFWANKVLQKSIYDIVVVGDSRIYRGINTRILEKRLNLKAYNFGFSSAGLDSLLLTDASKLLDSNGAKILIIGLSPNSFMESSLKNTHLLTWRKKDKKDLYVKHYIYPYLNIFNSYSISDIYKQIKNESYYENFDIEKGFVASHKQPIDSTSAIDAYKKQFKEEQYSLEAEIAFIRILTQFKKQGYTIYIIRVPVSTEMYQLEQIYFQTELQLKEQLSISGIEFIELNHISIKTYDGSHLEWQSANKISEILASKISK